MHGGECMTCRAEVRWPTRCPRHPLDEVVWHGVPVPQGHSWHVTWSEALAVGNHLARFLWERRRVYRQPCGCWSSIPLSLWPTTRVQR